MDLSDNVHLDDEVRSCLRLADDPDETVSHAVMDRLYRLGPSIMPQLTGALKTMDSAVARGHIERVVHRFKLQPLLELRAVIGAALERRVDIDLESAVRLLDQFRDPTTDTRIVRTYMDDVALRVHEMFITKAPANDLTQMLCIHEVLFEHERFGGAEDRYHDPDASYLSAVIANKTGIPIALGILYQLVAERVGFDVVGIGLPYHYVLYTPALELYIDVFHGGIFITREDCMRFIQQSGLTFNESMLRPLTSLQILERMIRNLHFAHARCVDLWEAATLQELLHDIAS
jgi:regulator of sirC expression with transglutaminase-like and TPR domain